MQKQKTLPKSQQTCSAEGKARRFNTFLLLAGRLSKRKCEIGYAPKKDSTLCMQKADGAKSRQDTSQEIKRLEQEKERNFSRSLLLMATSAIPFLLLEVISIPCAILSSALLIFFSAWVAGKSFEKEEKIRKILMAEINSVYSANGIPKVPAEREKSFLDAIYLIRNAEKMLKIRKMAESAGQNSGFVIDEEKFMEILKRNCRYLSDEKSFLGLCRKRDEAIKKGDAERARKIEEVIAVLSEFSKDMDAEICRAIERWNSENTPSCIGAH